jgi:astacin
MGMSTPGFNGGMQVQPLQLQPSGCGELGIVLHELGHALGMAHEQSRPDRDQSVTIHWQNVQQGYEGQFEVDADAYTDQDYDYTSVMHYGSTSFSKNGQPTITTP